MRTLPAALLLLLTACVSHSPIHPSSQRHIGPYPQPQGRMLLLGNHRAQLQFRCQWHPPGGACRFTHAASGRIIELRWQQLQLWQRSNEAGQQQWHAITMASLYSLGLVIHPAIVMQILNGSIPPWLKLTGNNRWRGKRHQNRIEMRWYPEQRRLDLSNLSKGSQVRILLSRGRAAP